MVPRLQPIPFQIYGAKKCAAKHLKHYIAGPLLCSPCRRDQSNLPQAWNLVQWWCQPFCRSDSSICNIPSSYIACDLAYLPEIGSLHDKVECSISWKDPFRPKVHILTTVIEFNDTSPAEDMITTLKWWQKALPEMYNCIPVPKDYFWTEFIGPDSGHLKIRVIKSKNFPDSKILTQKLSG